MPFGIAGVMSGGTKCFFSYSGYDSPAVTGAEAKNPKRDIPLSMMISLIIVFIIYFSISSVLTLAKPYYLEVSNRQIICMMKPVTLCDRIVGKPYTRQKIFVQKLYQVLV